MLNAELAEILFRKLHVLQRYLRKTTGDHFDPLWPSKGGIILAGMTKNSTSMPVDQKLLYYNLKFRMMFTL